MNKSNPDRIWAQFVATSKEDGSVSKVRVQSMGAGQRQACADLLADHFVKDATIGRHSGIHGNPDAVQECKEYMWYLLSKPTVHAHVYLADDVAGARPALLGVSIMQLVSRDDPEDIFQYKARTEEMQRYLSHLEYIMVQLYRPAALLARYHVDRYYHDMGLVVHPDYRQLGVARHDGGIRRAVSRAHGVPVSAVWCTARGSQRVFAADGWETVCEVAFEELGAQLAVTFHDTPPTCQLLAIRVDSEDK